MTATHLKRIAGLVVILLALWGIARLLHHAGDHPETAFRIPVVSADSADTIIAAAGRETVTVVRTGPGRWTANGFGAAPGAITEFFSAFATAGAPELVAQSPTSFARLGVDSAGAHRIRVARGGKTLVDLFVSDHGPDYQSAFLRRPGDSAVYAVGGGFAAIGRRHLEDWRDRSIVAVAPDSVREIALERGAHRTVLTRRAHGWQFASGAPADSGAVRALLEHWRSVTAAGFPTAAELDSTFRHRAIRRATLRSVTGVLAALEFDSTSGSFWVRPAEGGGRDRVYRLASWDADQLVPADSTFKTRKR